MLDTHTPETTGTAPAPPRPPKQVAPIATMIGIVVLAILVLGVSAALINAAGWSTRMSHLITIVAAGATAALTLLVANKVLLKPLPWWAFPLAVIAIVAIVSLGYVWRRGRRSRLSRRPDRKDARSAFRRNRQARAARSADPRRKRRTTRWTSSSHAESSIWRGRRSPTARRVSTRRCRAACGARSVRAKGDSIGHYEVRVVTDPAERLTLGHVIGRDDLVDPSDSNGYRFVLDGPRKVYLALQPIDPPDLPLEMTILKANGFPAARPRAVGVGWQTFQEFPPGKYVVSVRSPEGTTGSYSLSATTHAPEGTPTQTTVASSHVVAVPHVVGLPRADAERQLFDAGLALAVDPRVQRVRAAGVARQVVRFENQQAIEIDGLAGVVPAERQQRSGTEVVIKIGTGEACN